MVKRDIKKLANQTYATLDEKTIDKIVALLSKKNLKEYIRQIKFITQQQEVIIALPRINEYNKDAVFFAALFENKKIIYTEDASLLLGAKICDNDMIYEINLKNRLNQTITQIEQQYE